MPDPDEEVSKQKAYRELGKALLGDTFGATRLSDAEAEESGLAWLKSVLPILRERICNNAEIHRLFRSEGALLRNSVLTTVLDTTLNGLFGGIPVTTISQAVIAYGLHELCSGLPK
jgi:hypothetical protein